MKLLEQIKERIFIKWLLWQTRKGRIHRELVRLEQKISLQRRKDNPAKSTGDFPGSRNQVTVAAIQGELKLVSRVEEYVAQMFHYTAEAAGKGADLVVFPEDNGAHLVGLLPGIGDLDPSLEMDQALKEMTGDEVTVGGLFNYLSPVTNQVFHHTFSRLAQMFQVYIMPGSIIIPGEDGQMINRAFLYDSRGQLVGSQTKTHLLPIEVTWGLSCGQELQVFDTPLGRLAFPVCMDASYYETFRLLTLMGAEIILLPTANPEEYNYYKALRGIWPRVQENLVYGVKSTLVGQAFGLTLTGKAGIYAPLELTRSQDGVINESANHDREDVVVAMLDLEALRKKRANEARAGKYRFNLELYRKYFPELYQEYARK